MPVEVCWQLLRSARVSRGLLGSAEVCRDLQRSA